MRRHAPIPISPLTLLNALVCAVLPGALSCAVLSCAVLLGPLSPPARAQGVVLQPPRVPAHPAVTLQVLQNFYEDGRLRTQWQVRPALPDEGKEEGRDRVPVEPGGLVRHGTLLRYHPNGRLALRGQYRDGRPTGVWRWFDERGRLLRSAAPQGDYDEVIVGRDLENPNTIYRDPKGRKLAEGLRKYDLPHGAWTYYHPDGSVRAQGRFVNGLPDGRWVIYYHSGLIERLDDYKLGVPDGEVLRGHPNGQEQLEGRVEQGLRIGTWRTWFPNGQRESEGDYREDRREGEWRFWDSAGRLVRHVRYAGGKVAEELPLPQPRASAPQIVSDPGRLPFRPHLYDESGAEIRLDQFGPAPRPPAPALTPAQRSDWGRSDPEWTVIEPKAESPPPAR